MGTLPLIIRIIKLLWACLPFITTVVFDDRPVKEVIRENLAFTVIFILFVVMTVSAFMTAATLENLGSEHIELEKLNTELEARIADAQVRLQTLRSELEVCSNEDAYDPTRALRRLYN